MSDASPHFIPHPLCLDDPKIIKLQWDKQGLQSLRDYFQASPNPRWAASHLVRSIARALIDADPDVSSTLSAIADKLSVSK